MNRIHIRSLALAATLAAAGAHASIIVSEVSPYSSGNAPYAQDWFELTNTGDSAVAVSGWVYDDDSNSFASGAVLNGITSIGAGESVVYIAGTSAAADAFKTFWFGANVPVGLQVGTHNGPGLGTGGDAVNIFDSAGVRLAGVSFGAASIGQTFDNAAGLSSSTLPLPVLSTFSIAGVNGAFSSAAALSSGVPVGTLDIGSPGTIAAVPEPASWALMLGGLVGLAGIARRRQG